MSSDLRHIRHREKWHARMKRLSMVQSQHRAPAPALFRGCCLRHEADRMGQIWASPLRRLALLKIRAWTARPEGRRPGSC
jgi:hypothetical protein